MTSGPRFLSISDVVRLQTIAISDQGGVIGIRDMDSLESAIAAPQSAVFDNYLHDSIQDMASAYAFHICRNHPFIDGNKRAAIAALIAFLSDNGWSFEATADEAEPVVLQMAAGQLDKEEFTDWARNYMREKPKIELRDFFRRISWRDFNERFISLLPAETGADPNEYSERASEAAGSMPILRDLAREQLEALESGNQIAYERVTMLATGLMTLHALAEDMGYEW
ncbi:MAG: type II toxin-antitoxin system death-on-curing family toxin [Planctomycetes bacterium]|nr:type II toxin-antitoxin system death-on-curing family toxin [Planctomycetota bacterium]